MSSLTVEKSQLYPDISDIIKNHKDKYNGAFLFETKLHTEEKDLDYTDGVILNSITIVRDYVNNMSDYIEVQLTMHLGTYIYDVYKFLDNIELTLSVYKQLYQNKKPFIVTERYKAAYILEKNSNIPTTVNQSKEDLDQNLPITLTLQLLDRSAETLRIKTTQGSFDKAINPKNKDMTIKPFLKSIISEQVNKILVENKPIIDNISIEEPDNQDELKSVTIPSCTRVVELPELIQTKNIGIYNAGVGNYLQKFGIDPFTYKKTFFIYSLYDPSKYEKAEYKIMFYSPVSSSNSITEITYKYEDKILKVLTHSMSKINDNKETDIMSSGSGYRVSNANSYMKKPVEMTKDGPKFKRDRLNSEVIYKERKDNLNFAPNKSTVNNQFVLTSEVLQRKGNYVTIEVSNLDHDFIYPGPCKISYEDSSNKVKDLNGVIHQAYITYSTTNMPMTQNYSSKVIALTSHVSLHVFVTTDED